MTASTCCPCASCPNPLSRFSNFSNSSHDIGSPRRPLCLTNVNLISGDAIVPITYILNIFLKYLSSEDFLWNQLPIYHQRFPFFKVGLFQIPFFLNYHFQIHGSDHSPHSSEFSQVIS